MRVILSGVLAGLLLSQGALAQCVRPTDHSAFDVTGLKTHLMVTALTCAADEKYNAFVIKYRPELTSQDKALGGWFTRTHGRRARQQQDDYITQLANSRSQDGIRQGSLFCTQNLGLFDEVMALRSGAELTDYAAGKTVAQPISATECAASPTTTRARRRS
ncbi:MAG: hypothetical protein H7Z10_05940 [Gemmatimonadaceae bacterium]|nr:hypothetical protein [Acetobacteraceae bacterium]